MPLISAGRYGALIGLIAGVLVGAVWLAWRINLLLGFATSAMACFVAVWLWRKSPVYILGSRNPALDGQRLPGENAVLFVCGFLVGGIIGLVGAPASIKSIPMLCLFAAMIGVILGVLSIVFRDRIWSRQ